MHPLERTLRQSAIFLGVALNSVDISVCCPAGVGVLLHLALSLGGGNRHNHGLARSIGLSVRIMSLRRSQPWVCLLSQDTYTAATSASSKTKAGPAAALGRASSRRRHLTATPWCSAR